LYRFELLGTRILIDRLLRRNLHEFATLVTKLLRMPPEEGANRILVQWAVQEVSFQRYICSSIELVLWLADLTGISWDVLKGFSSSLQEGKCRFGC
jgi:hypothetical protein